MGGVPGAQHNAPVVGPDGSGGVENGIAATLLDGQARSLTMLLAVAVLTAAVAVAARRRLTRAYRAELDAGARRHSSQTRSGGAVVLTR